MLISGAACASPLVSPPKCIPAIRLDSKSSAGAVTRSRVAAPAAVPAPKVNYAGLAISTVSFPRRRELRMKYTAPYTPHTIATPTAISGSLTLPRPSIGPMM